MQSVAVATTVRVGNHTLTPDEAAAGVPQRDPFVGEDGLPVDPSTVGIWLQAPTGQVRSFAYPAAGAGDTGVVTKQETGRFYVDWTPDDPEDGVWRWFLVGAMTFGSSLSDQDVFYAKRPIVPVP